MSAKVSRMKNRPLPATPVDRKNDDWILHPLSVSSNPRPYILSGLNDYVPVNTNSIVEKDSSNKLTRIYEGIYGGEKRTYTIPSHNKTESAEKDTVASTISAITNRFLQTQQPFLRPCPIGLTDLEKEKFCTYMEFSHSSLKEGGWKDLTERLLLLNDEDFTLIENFCDKTKIPVMEIILEHWSLLHILLSSKCLREPTKAVLVTALKEMCRPDIISNMKW